MKITAESLKKAAYLQDRIHRTEEMLRQAKLYQLGTLEVQIASSKFYISDTLRGAMIEIVERELRIRKAEVRELGFDVT